MKKALLLLFALGTMTHTIAKSETTEHFVGGDISLLPSYEQYNTPYYDRDGKTISDVVTYVKESCGWNAIRVRIFVDPKERTSSKSGVVQDLAYVKKLGKRVKDASMKLMVDFHYSDCWADPSYQDIPSRWKQRGACRFGLCVYEELPHRTQGLWCRTRLCSGRQRDKLRHAVAQQ